MDNYAIRALKERVVSQIAIQVLFDGVMQHIEQEIDEIDTKKRINKPPRKRTRRLIVG